MWGFSGTPQGHGKSGGVGPHTISHNHSQSSNPESPDLWGSPPWKVVTVSLGSKETSKVERKELRQLLFDLDQAIRNGLF